MGAAKGPLSGLGRLVSALAGRGRAAAEKGAEAEDTQVAPAAASREAGEKGEVTPGAPATAETETEAAPSESALDMAALVRELLGSREPLGRLRGFVTDVEGPPGTLRGRTRFSPAGGSATWRGACVRRGSLTTTWSCPA